MWYAPLSSVGPSCTSPFNRPLIPQNTKCFCEMWQASIWEHKALLSESQEKAVESIAALCSHRPLPEHVHDLLPLVSNIQSKPSCNQPKLRKRFIVTAQYLDHAYACSLMIVAGISRAGSSWQS
jgi:hypothetical protein